MEGFPALIAILGLLALACLPFLVLFWVLKKIFFGVRTKARYIKLLIPDGVPVQGRITSTFGGGSAGTGRMRAYVRFEYFDTYGNRYMGEKSRSGESVGDEIDLMYLPSSPEVHEVAEVILAFREKRKPIR